MKGQTKLSDDHLPEGPDMNGSAHSGAVLKTRPWFSRFREQYGVLVFKNVLVSFRSYRSTLLRLLSPFFFMLLLFLVNIAIRADDPNEPLFADNPNPSQTSVDPIPDCATDVYVQLPCWDFFYTPNNSSNVQMIVEAMRMNNPGRIIPFERVRGFASIEEVNQFLLDNPERTTAVVHFLEDGNTMGFSLQTNSTVKFFKGNYQDPVFFSLVPVQVAVEREIARFYWSQSARSPDAFEWSMAFSIFAHPSTTERNIVGSAMGPFVFAANMFTFVMLLSAVVTEKELGLRQALRTMGMLDSAFWLSWLTVEVVAGVVFTLVLIGFGAAFQFDFFLKNAFALVFVLFLLFQLAMISVSFVLSTFIRQGSSAVTWGFVVFIVGWIIQSIIAFGFPYTPEYITTVTPITVIFTLMPWSMLAKGSIDLGSASVDSTSEGLRWSQRSSYCMDIQDPTQQDAAFVDGVYQDFDCVFSLNVIYFVLLAEFLIYFVIAIYLDNVLPDKNGVRKKPWYLFTPSYWCGTGLHFRGQHSVKTARGTRTIKPSIPRTAEGVEAVDPDVQAEEDRMRELLNHRTGSGDALALQADAANAVEVYGLQRVFPAGKILGCFPKCGKHKKPDFWAIKGSWFGIEKGRLFCLLGPNGAGKTTTINCLTGVLPASGGDALIYGESLSTPGGMDRIRSIMGVCPQFDVLWNELTGAEHLQIYGRIKGIPRHELVLQAGNLLDQVKLTAASRVRTGAYSGGMKRRLSVAIALLGDPLVVYLDEPTTGMDPISRRHVWDIIEKAKKGRAIVLTTHSMEEADILGDNVAIMARGRLGAIGTTLRLKQRFGSGYQLSVSVMPATTSEHQAPLLAKRAEVVKELFKRELEVVPVDETRAYILFLVPKDREERLRAFLQQLEARRAELGLTDVQISLTSLEEVFLNIARKAELEAAAAEGRGSAKVQLDDGSFLEVPLGDEYALHPASGVRYHIKWGQDESGNLQVLRWTPANGTEPLTMPSFTNGASHTNGVNGVTPHSAPNGAIEMARS